MTQPPRDLRVAFFGNFLSGSFGGWAICEDLAERLKARGATVVTASHRRERVARLLEMVALAWGRRNEYDVAHVDVFSGLAFRWAEVVCLLLRRLGKPYVLTVRGGGLPNWGARHPRRLHRLLQTAACVTAPSSFLSEALTGFRSDIRLLPNAIDVPAYGGGVRERPTPRLVWLRSLHRVYNPVLAVQVLAKLAGRYPQASLCMAGPDKGDGARVDIRRAADRLGVNDRLDVPGNVPKGEVPRLLGRHDIFLNTTNIDNAPVSVIEAMAAGLCVVSTDVGGIPAICTHEKNALLVPPGNLHEMVAACLRVLEEPGLGRELSRRAVESVAAYDWTEVLPQWERLFAGVRDGRPSGRMSIQRFYDLRAATYWQESYGEKSENAHVVLLQKRRRLIGEMIAFAEGPSLELGCGSRGVLSASKPAVLGDVSFEMVRRAREVSGNGASAVQLAAQALPFRSERYRLVVAAGVLDYVPDVDAALGEIHRVLAPGGTAILTLPSPKRLEAVLRLIARPIERPLRRLLGRQLRADAPRPLGIVSRGYSRRRIRRMLASAGLSVERTRPFHYFYFPWQTLFFGASCRIDRLLERAEGRASMVGLLAQSHVYEARRIS